MPLAFTWDSRKAATNKGKHRVEFDEAMTVFSDQREIMIADPEHSQDEGRFVSIGLSESGRLLAVVSTETDKGMHIISARSGTPLEQAQYADHR